ncbi:hypothetical protein [Cellulomonas sp. SG140]|uniref:hypothetical protein n=1 Tax=Cellulomonas sp. SG140 TaxID=2976536 RepID=UPI0021E71432|nr:hypothetical protein [Cellulomonas sp. SG140]
MTTTGTAPRDRAARPTTLRGRLATAATGTVGAVVGLAPHVLHHIGPLLGVALVAGTGGTILFGLLGLAASVPMLLRLHRRFHTWRAPALALALFGAAFAVSTLVIGPMISGSRSPGVGPAPAPAVSEPAGHASHHG